jgi:hypothetical protein
MLDVSRLISCVAVVLCVLNNDKLMLDVLWLLFVCWNCVRCVNFVTSGICYVLFVLSYSVLACVLRNVNFGTFLL